MTFDRDEVEAAFRTYWQLGAVGEDWDAWCDTCFTEDVTYIEHILGNKQGREAVRAWIKPTMADYGEIYTAYEWHMVDDSGRVVVYMQNRRDNPEPGAPPIDFPGMTVLQYAGNGQFSLEEDFWSWTEGGATFKEYVDQCKKFDPDFRHKRTRRNWGNGPEWTQGASTYAESLGAQKRRSAASMAMPEAPQMQALAERVAEWLVGRDLRGLRPARLHRAEDGRPAAGGARRRASSRVDRRAKYVTLHFDNDLRDHVPPLAGGPARLRAAAEEDAAEGLGRALAVLRRPRGAAARVRHRTQGGLVGARARRRRARSRSSDPRRRARSSRSGSAPPTTVGASTRSCATSARSRASGAATPTTSCTGPSSRRTRR